MRTVFELLHASQHVISELELVTGSNSVFEVDVDDRLLFSKRAAGRHAEPGERYSGYSASRSRPGGKVYER